MIFAQLIYGYLLFVGNFGGISWHLNIIENILVIYYTEIISKMSK